jgi:hypothetical protein
LIGHLVPLACPAGGANERKLVDGTRALDLDLARRDFVVVTGLLHDALEPRLAVAWALLLALADLVGLVGDRDLPINELGEELLPENEL